YSLRWNNIIVEQSIRKFITQTSITRGFEFFYYLNRNIKYRNNLIDWMTTFAALDNNAALHTEFYASNRKAKRIKFMMEELSTIEQMTKSAPHIYKGWNCMFVAKLPKRSTIYGPVVTMQPLLQILEMRRNPSFWIQLMLY